MYLNVVKNSGLSGARGLGSAPWIPFPMPFWPAPNPAWLVRSPVGLHGLGAISANEDCDTKDSACVARNFERSVQRNAEIATATNRINRANCMNDWTRTPTSCLTQWPDVSERDLWDIPTPMQLAPYTPTGYQPAPYVPPGAAGSAGGQYATTNQPPYVPPAAQIPRSVALENLSRPGQVSSWLVGDNWRITVTGPAGQPVQGSSVHNGTPAPASNFGTTDATGRAVLTGTMTADTVGTWSEPWTVGGQPAGTLTFTVSLPPSASPGAAVSCSADAMLCPDGSSVGRIAPNCQFAPCPSGATNGGAATSFDFSFLTKPVNVFGFSIPLVGLAAGAGLAWFMFAGGRRR